jgi:hypothetical protein
MVRTAESITEEATFRKLVRAVPGLRPRVTLDPEGWPTIPARYGRLEWRGAAGLAGASLYAYTDRKSILRRLMAVPGVRPYQLGDEEGVVSVAASDHPTVLACARLLRCQTNGRGGAPRSPEGRARALEALRAANAAKRALKTPVSAA